MSALATPSCSRRRACSSAASCASPSTARVRTPARAFGWRISKTLRPEQSGVFFDAHADVVGGDQPVADEHAALGTPVNLESAEAATARACAGRECGNVTSVVAHENAAGRAELGDDQATAGAGCDRNAGIVDDFEVADILVHVGSGMHSAFVNRSAFLRAAAFEDIADFEAVAQELAHARRERQDPRRQSSALP